jgi:WD40 repeat protein
VSVAPSPDGKLLLTGGGNPLRLWDVETGKELRQFAGHRFAVTRAAWAPDGKTVYSSSYDGTVRGWDVATGRQVRQFSGQRGYVWSVAVSPDGRSVLSAGGGLNDGMNYVPGEDFGIRLWPVSAGGPAKTATDAAVPASPVRARPAVRSVPPPPRGLPGS